jgi:ABC-type proline/glycine betaine transport system ATPase subunit
MENQNQEIILTPAEKYYKNHLKNVSNYQKKNPEKMKTKNKSYFNKMKEDTPEKYTQYLEKKKQYYQTKKALKNAQINNDMIAIFNCD